MSNLVEHNEHCESIVKDLQAYYNGDVFSFEGDIYNVNDLEVIELDGIEYYEINNTKVDCDDIEPLYLYDYFDDFYDIDYILDNNRELKAVRVMVACGGPNIFINTYDRQVELYWWSESGKAYLDNDLCEAINDLFRELYF